MEIRSDRISDLPAACVQSGASIRKLEQRVRDEIIFDESILIGCDWLDATSGKAITQDEYTNLEMAGFASHQPTELLRVFYDWEDYQRVTRTFYEDKVLKKEKEEKDLLDQIFQEYELGLIPEYFFQQTEMYFIDNPGGKKKKLSRYKLTDEKSPQDEIIRRYYRYQLINEIIAKYPNPSKTEMSESRKVNIVMGYNVENGSLLTSLTSELQKSNSALTEKDIKETADDLGIYEYIYPGSRDNHLQRLLDAGKTSELVPYFDTENGVLLDSQIEKRRYLEENPRAKTHIKILGKLLLAETVEKKFGARAKFKDWTKEDYVRYGRWLTKVLEPYGKIPDTRVLIRAQQLGIGPGIRRINGVFSGSTINLFKEIGVVKKNIGHEFDGMTIDDACEYVRSAAAHFDGKVSISLLRRYYHDMKEKGVDIPSPETMSTQCKLPIGEIIEASGFRIASREISVDDCARSAARFYAENGHWPTAREVALTKYLPSWPTVLRRCGSLGNLHKFGEAYLKETTRHEPSDYEDEEDGALDFEPLAA
jgi:hypothetical protein